ncbi:MAG: RNA methyltransferase, partial [Armatimonadetes bacterium]|nr:RNA methyltransferase [Armatimonadota bacterium]
VPPLWVHEVTPEVLEAMAGTDAPQGVLAVVDTAAPTLEDVLASGPRLLVLLSHVRDPGNAGTVIRGADAAGADAVLVSDASVDVHAPKVVRSTAGSLFHLPVVTGLYVDATLARLRAAGLRTLAADGSGTTLLPDADLTGPHCWVMGNEAWGLPEETRSRCAFSSWITAAGDRSHCDGRHLQTRTWWTSPPRPSSPPTTLEDGSQHGRFP